MVKANIENTVISMVLDDDETTVPPGESWQITLTNNDASNPFEINGSQVFSPGDAPLDITVTGGDTLSAGTNDLWYITGYVVNE